jgi:hypothetical protein
MIGGGASLTIVRVMSLNPAGVNVYFKVQTRTWDCRAERRLLLFDNKLDFFADPRRWHATILRSPFESGGINNR